MFEREITVNEFLAGLFERTAADIAEETLFQNSVGHGHSPVWILGHLAIVGEFGQRLLGGSVTHPDWLRLFGPGSTDSIAPSPELTKASLTAATIENYRQLRSLASTANPDAMLQPHSLSLLQGTQIKTVGDCMTHLLTSHFNFHLAQLSSCRRAAGHSYMF